VYFLQKRHSPHGPHGPLATQPGVTTGLERGELTLTVAREVEGRVEKAEALPSNSQRVSCVSCGHTLCETFAETPEGVKVWTKMRCRNRGCGSWNVILYFGGRVSVAQV